MNDSGVLYNLLPVCITPLSGGLYLNTSTLSLPSMALFRPSTNLCPVVAWYSPCYLFYVMTIFISSSRGEFFWVTPLCWSALTMIWNVAMDSCMIFYSLWNLTFLFLLSPRTLFLSWVMSLIIIVCSAKYFRRIYTSGKKSTKLSENVVGLMGSWY